MIYLTNIGYCVLVDMYIYRKQKIFKNTTNYFKKLQYCMINFYLNFKLEVWSINKVILSWCYIGSEKYLRLLLNIYFRKNTVFNYNIVISSFTT